MLNLKSGKHFTEPSARSQMTRGGFLKGILASGIAPSITMGVIANAGSANANVRGAMRNVGARQAAMFGKPTAKDYVQDGLIAMWDGKNGITQNNWTDIVGGKVFNLYNITIVDNGVLFAGNASSYGQMFDDIFNSDADLCIEIALRFYTVINERPGIILKTNKNALGLFNVGHYCVSSIASYTSSIFPDRGGWEHHIGLNCFSSNYTKNICSSSYWNGENQIFSMTDNVGGTSTGVMLATRDQGTYSYKGEINAIRVYSRNLVSAEVSHNYAIDKARFNLP